MKYGNTMLSEVLEKFDKCKQLSISNYDKKLIGNHHVGDFLEALDNLDEDFCVISVDDSDDIIDIIIQENNQDNVINLKYEADVKAQSHDKYFGDGKYWKKSS